MIIQRINFIDKTTFVFTYRKMVIGAGLVAGLLILVYGAGIARTVWVGKKVSRLTEEVNRLKAEKEKVLKESDAMTGGPASARAALMKVFDDSISWSLLLREITVETPRSLWLTSIKSYDKSGPSGRSGILLNGQSEEAGSVTLFLKSLSDSPWFENVVLTSSKQETGTAGVVYQFSIDLNISSPPDGRSL